MRPAKYDSHSIMNGILWIAKARAPWRELLEGYGAAAIRKYIIPQRPGCTIPSKSNKSNSCPVYYHIYYECHLVERFFQKLKWHCRIFTRYDKIDACFRAFVYTSAIVILLK